MKPWHSQRTMNRLSTILLISLILWFSEGFTLSRSTKSKYTSNLRAFHEKNDSTVDLTDRRKILQGLMASTIIAKVPTFSAYAVSEELNLFQDTVTGFQIKYPSSWTRTDQTLPDRRRLTLFINNDDMGKDKDLMFIAYTSVRDDFTSLGSFGSVDQVGSQTILPKGELMGEKTESEMLGSESKKNSYYFDYVSKVPNQPKVSKFYSYIGCHVAACKNEFKQN